MKSNALESDESHGAKNESDGENENENENDVNYEREMKTVEIDDAQSCVRVFQNVETWKEIYLAVNDRGYLHDVHLYVIFLFDAMWKKLMKKEKTSSGYLPSLILSASSPVRDLILPVKNYGGENSEKEKTNGYVSYLSQKDPYSVFDLSSVHSLMTPLQWMKQLH